MPGEWSERFSFSLYNGYRVWQSNKQLTGINRSLLNLFWTIFLFWLFFALRVVVLPAGREGHSTLKTIVDVFPFQANGFFCHICDTQIRRNAGRQSAYLRIVRIWCKNDWVKKAARNWKTCNKKWLIANLFTCNIWQVIILNNNNGRRHITFLQLLTYLSEINRYRFLSNIHWAVEQKMKRCCFFVWCRIESSSACARAPVKKPIHYF